MDRQNLPEQKQKYSKIICNSYLVNCYCSNLRVIMLCTKFFYLLLFFWDHICDYIFKILSMNQQTKWKLHSHLYTLYDQRSDIAATLCKKKSASIMDPLTIELETFLVDNVDITGSRHYNIKQQMSYWTDRSS